MHYAPSDEKLNIFENGPFSNSHFAEFEEKDESGKVKKFTSSEQYFTYYKALTFDDFESAEKILRLTDPGEIQAMGSRVKNFDYNDEKWAAVREGIMKKALVLKYSQNPHLLKCLLDTNDQFLVESTPRRRRCGIVMCENDNGAVDPTRWRGQNILEKALMEVREELRNQQ